MRDITNKPPKNAEKMFYIDNYAPIKIFENIAVSIPT